MNTVTTGNKKHSKGFGLRCKSTGLYLSDATHHFEVVAVSYRENLAFSLPTAEAAESARKIVKALYGSFDWQSVPVEG
jgi:hypothetical protein